MAPISLGICSVDHSLFKNAKEELIPISCTNITETVGSAWATPTHDTAGNMTAIPKPSDLTASYDATWDAWHRLVSLKEGATTVAGYQYDGNGRRMVKEIYSAGALDETRHVYYSTQSQAIEERVDSSTDAEIQFVWNLGYVDDLLLRDRDTSANGVLDERLYSLPDLRYCVMALADSSGAVVERFTYDALGKALVMSPLFGARTGSNYDWEFRYTGRREDLETGLMYFRARYFSNDLGRFISRDPLGFVDGVNLYRGWFVAGAVDPEGTDIWIQTSGHHHQICVDYWTVCNHNQAHIGVRCFSFGLSIWEIWPRDGICCPGRVFETDPMPAPGGVYYKKTTCKEDMAFLDKITDHVGHAAPYNLFTRNCQTFSKDWFDEAPGDEIDLSSDKYKKRLEELIELKNKTKRPKK